MNRHSPILLALVCLLAAPVADASQPDCECKPVAVRKKQSKKPKVQRVKVSAEAAAPALPPVVAPPPQPPQPPTVVAVTLAAGSDNCTGSIDGKSGLTDWNCVLLRKSAALANVGKEQAAIALLCDDDKMRDALERTGTSCEAIDIGEQPNDVEPKPTLERPRRNADLVVKR